MSQLFIHNRKKTVQMMAENSVLILSAGSLVTKCGDEFYPFTPRRNFYYLTGIDSPGLWMTVYKKDAATVETTLYLQRHDAVKAKWVGTPLQAAEAAQKSGIPSFRWIDEFESAVTRLLFTEQIDVVYMDMERRDWMQPFSEELAFANGLKERFPALAIKNAYPIFGALRMIKSEEEIKRIQKAIDLTGEAIDLMMRNTRPGMAEYEIEAYFDYTLKKHGVRDRAFATIAAAGKNATILHYNENNAKTSDGELILFDVGAQIDYYAADISRTFPVNGRFSDRQKTLYNIVLAGQQKVIAAICPGVPFAALNELLIDHYAEALRKIGLIKEWGEVARYYYHGVSHMLGLETHDIGRHREGVLQKGMVFTVEPGLYIEEEAIGIRIEDVVAVTEQGCTVLSRAIPKTVDAIETLMRQG